MKEWIFKMIYYPIFGIGLMCCLPILIMLLKEVGWHQPFRWLCIIGAMACAADYFVNK